ncbi:MAG TPA: hypothetical protein VLZ83_11780 [Edaphocola sp.]|nr:hypothetical protein [Edaphocola sp.]
MIHKNLLLLFFLLVQPLVFFAQGPIYITLDVSPSMKGQRYNLANYSAQTLSVLNQNREIIFVVNSTTNKISNNYKTIQKDMNDFGGFQNSEIRDIYKLNEIINPKTPEQDVFIIGDGSWAKSEQIYGDFVQIIKAGNIKASFLATHNYKNLKSSFENFFDSTDLGKKYRVANAGEIIEAINNITEEITGVSAIPTFQLNKLNKCISFSTEMAARSLKVMYQDQKNLNDLPKIVSVIINGIVINTKELGSPSNQNYANKSTGLMSSRVYELLKQIPAGSKIEICFDKETDLEKLKIYPIVEAQIGNFNLSVEKGQIKKTDENTFEVCRDNNSVEVYFEINQKNNKIPEDLLSQAKVNVISEHKTYNTTYENERFSAVIPINKNTTTYHVESELEGYFRKTSGQKKIIKTDDCKPAPKPKLEPLPMQYLHFGEISLDNLLREGRISSRIVDEKTQETIDPMLFDIEVSNNYKALFKSVKMEFRDSGWIDLIIEPRGEWCDCFIPNLLKIDFYAEPKNELVKDGLYYRPIQAVLTVDIIKEQSWLERCSWLLFSLIGSLLLSLYLILLSRKKRFRRGSKIVFKYPNISSRKTLNPSYISTDFKLRKSGFLAWVNRWLIPFGTEKSTIAFNSIDLTLLFVAAKSLRYVYFPKTSFNESNMESINYDSDKKDKLIQMDENSELKVTHQRLAVGKTTNFLSYAYPKSSWNDISTYRFVLGMFILFLLSYFFIALILIIKSLL